jgi:hypothetical protein
VISKYGNKKTAGFASRREAKRYADLYLLEKAGEIRDLKCQVPFVLIPANKIFRETKYFADFTYLDKSGQLVVEDAKGYKTPEFRIKEKLMYSVHGIVIQCT